MEELDEIAWANHHGVRATEKGEPKKKREFFLLTAGGFIHLWETPRGGRRKGRKKMVAIWRTENQDTTPRV